MFSRLSPYWLWLLLSLPALAFMSQSVSSPDPKVFHQLLHPTGEFGARLLIISMLASPLALVFRGWRGPAWLKKNRRYFGVAAFGYTMLHLVFYFVDRASLTKAIGEVTQLDIWTGWLAFFIFLALAATSFDGAVKAMGTRWKTLQRWVYLAAALTLLHWAAHDEFKGIGPALVHFGPLLLLESYRLWYWYLRPPARVA